jgi:hypothetical protein
MSIVLTITSESLLWAATIFTSRAFISTHILPEIETIPILFPVVDILNHSVTARVEWDFKPHQSFTLRCLSSSTFAAGEELFNNYAPKQNDELLLGYGFCLDDNPIEQFALKLAFPPMLQQYAQEMGLLSPGSVPFGMDKTFLETDPNTEQHFLRAKAHPFGRYNNHIPFFRGIPPYIVHFFFIQTLLALEKTPDEINIEHPGDRITLQVLVLLHQALSQRCSTLPITFDKTPQNEKQRYAKVYRNSQARIIHSVRNELGAAIDTLRVPSNTTPPHRPALLTVSNALAALRVEYPDAASRLEAGISKHKLQGPGDERLIWTIVLITYAALVLTRPDVSDGAWLAVLTSAHTLPRLEDGIEDAETYGFLDEHLGDFLELPTPETGLGPTDVLDDLGMTFVEGKGNFIDGPTENLGVRLLMWGMNVAQAEVLPVSGEGQTHMCLYITHGNGGAEWIYREVEGGEETA